MPPHGFQAFTVKANGIADRILTDVTVSDAFDPRKPPDPLPKALSCKALWDTGATKSGISANLAQSLGLVPTGQVTVNHAGGSGPRPTYVINLALPHQVGVFGLQTMEFTHAPGSFEVIIGMDVICLGDFSISNVGGQTWVSFRTPSCVAVDYVAEANAIRNPKVGRNDPCPCGQMSASGKPVKYKKCHGA